MKDTALQDYTVSKDEVSVEIDVKSLLGPISKDRDVREAFFQVALDKLLERLDNGRNYENRIYAGKAKEYSKEYKESLDFQAFNKSNTVNMQLTDGMRSSIDMVDQNENAIKIAIGSEHTKKAYGHISGFEGHKFIKGFPKREFFGWTDKELKEIAQDFKPLARGEAPVVTDEKILKLLDRLLGNE